MNNNHKVFFVNHPPYAVSKIVPEINYEWAKNVFGTNVKKEKNIKAKINISSFQKSFQKLIKVFG